MAAGEDGDERPLNDDILAEDDRRRRLVRPLHPLGGRLQTGDNVGVRVGKGAHDDQGSLIVLGTGYAGASVSLTNL